MASKIKVTISLDKALATDLEGVSRERRTPRSRLIEEALRFWRRSRLEQQLKEGYEAMARADRATAEETLAAGREAMR
jgi:metal-responsive CopG/Arc/MetJ family transcriptional regulator